MSSLIKPNFLSISGPKARPDVQLCDEEMSNVSKHSKQKKVQASFDRLFHVHIMRLLKRSSHYAPKHCATYIAIAQELF